jgi:hypothetical protein
MFVELLHRDTLIKKLWQRAIDSPHDSREYYWQIKDQWILKYERKPAEVQLFYKVVYDLAARYKAVNIHQKIKNHRPELLLFLILKHPREAVFWPLDNELLEQCPEWRHPSQLSESLTVLIKTKAVVSGCRGRKHINAVVTHDGKLAGLMSMYPDKIFYADTMPPADSIYKDIVNFYEVLAKKYRD